MKRTIIGILLLVVITTLSACGNAKTIDIKDANDNQLKATEVAYVSDGCLYLAPKDGSYQIKIASDVLTPAFKGGKNIYFLTPSFGKSLLARYNYKDNALEVLDYYVFPQDATFWDDFDSGSLDIIIKAYFDEEAMNNDNIAGIAISMTSGDISTWSNLDADTNYGIDDFNVKPKTSIDVSGWNVSTDGSTLTFTNGSTTNKIHGKNIYLISQIF